MMKYMNMEEHHSHVLSQGTPMTDKCRQLWDQLGALWVCVVLNPTAGRAEKEAWQKLLLGWTRTEVCPLEDPDYKPAARRQRNLSSGSSDEDSGGSDTGPLSSSE